ncbi:hypothetical protein DITRI_Ditri08aG0160600 [Diplodiscus trichospermus]
MEGETSNEETKMEVGEEVEPISVQRCCNQIVHDHQSGDNQPICRYNECRRNHAASFGRYAVDGCGEFISCNDNVFTCAACGCHRNFHRKDPPNNATTVLPAPRQPMPPQRRPLLAMAPLPLACHNQLTGETSLFIRDRNNIDAGSEALSGANVEEENDKKRKRAKRTKLTVEQKSKMMRFADQLGWRCQRHLHAEIEEFCEEVGITKRVFVIWLNNNRHRKDQLSP